MPVTLFVAGIGKVQEKRGRCERVNAKDSLTRWDTHQF